MLVNSAVSAVRRMGPVVKPVVQNFSKKVESSEKEWTPRLTLSVGAWGISSVAALGFIGDRAVDTIKTYVKTGELPKSKPSSGYENYTS